MALIPPNPVGVVPGSGLWNDWIEKIRSAVNSTLSSINWTLVTGTTTTFSGYGISTTSGNLAGSLTDETGTGVVVFNIAPVLNSPVHTGSNQLHVTTTTLADNSAGNVATLTNSPIVDNPTKWISINDNGTTRYIPTW